MGAETEKDTDLGTCKSDPVPTGVGVKGRLTPHGKRKESSIEVMARYLTIDFDRQ